MVSTDEAETLGKNPTTARIFKPGLLGTACGLLLTAAAPPLTEDEVIRLASERSRSVDEAEATSEAFVAQEVQARRYPNPRFTWNRQEVPGAGPGAETEDGLSISFPLDLSGRRSARSSLAHSSRLLSQAEVHLTRSSAVLTALEIFYRALHAELRASVARSRWQRLKEARRVVARRVAEGVLAAADQAQIQVEVALAKSAWSSFEVEAAAARAELTTFLGLPQETLLRGPLEAPTGGHSAPRKRPSRALARAAQDHAERALGAASRAWIPQISLMGGLFLRNTGTTALGYVAGISMALPLFSRGQGVEAEIAARVGLARALHASIEQRSRSRSASARLHLQWAKEEAFRLMSETKADLQSMERAAQRAYVEGRSTIRELVDALDLVDRVQARRLELAYLGRRAELSLRATRGEFE